MAFNFLSPKIKDHMETPEYPPNSRTTKQKDIHRVTKGEAKVKKKSLRRKFTELFIIGDFKTAVEFTMMEHVLPAARDLVWEAMSDGFLRSFIFGSNSRRRGATPPQAGPYGHIAYNRYATSPVMSSPQRAMSRQGRSRHDFDEIILESRPEAESVLDGLIEVISKYGEASVSDFYGLVGLNADHTDTKWGWTDVRGFGVSRDRSGGYVLDLPNPHPLQ